ncbi:TPA: hypothetical protein SMF26_004712 [Serratia marcescens]|nr:hypothetical protein [Serratia marcescens]
MLINRLCSIPLRLLPPRANRGGGKEKEKEKEKPKVKVEIEKLNVLDKYNEVLESPSPLFLHSVSR